MVQNILYVSLLIIIGGGFGSFVKFISKKIHSDDYLIDNQICFFSCKNIYLFFKVIFPGICTSFIAVPFTTSFIKLDYKTLLFSNLSSADPILLAQFIENSLMLVALAGITAYIGVAILDNIANKITQEQIDDIKEDVDESKKTTQETENKTKALEITIALLRVNSIIQEVDSNNVNSSNVDHEKEKNSLNQALKILEPYTDPKEHSKLLSSKACIYKRLGEISKALNIMDTLLAVRDDPLVLYNKGCYEYLIEKKDKKESAKINILKGLNLPVSEKSEIDMQKKLRDKLINKKDKDIVELFSPAELIELQKKWGL